MSITKNMMDDDDPTQFRADFMHYIASSRLQRESAHDATIEEFADIEGDLVDESYDDTEYEEQDA